MIEAMVCKSIGHKWKTINVSSIPRAELKHFQSPRALQAIIDTANNEGKDREIEYCTRCKVWDLL